LADLDALVLNLSMLALIWVYETIYHILLCSGIQKKNRIMNIQCLDNNA
jgi:hypothetical protein